MVRLTLKFLADATNHVIGLLYMCRYKLLSIFSCAKQLLVMAFSKKHNRGNFNKSGCLHFISFANNYCTREKFGREKFANLANCELFAKIFLANTHRYNLAYALTVAYLPLANSFYLYGLPKFSPAKYFLCTVC